MCVHVNHGPLVFKLVRMPFKNHQVLFLLMLGFQNTSIIIIRASVYIVCQSTATVSTTLWFRLVLYINVRMSAIYLSLSAQEQIFMYLKIMFVVSTVLNVIALLLLIRQTPQNQATIRNYLIIIQVLLMTSDIHLEIGLHGIPLFPALAGYAVGWLIEMGCSTYLAFIITVLLYVWIGDATVICILFRHQSLSLKGSKFKLKEATVRCIQCLLVLIPTIPVVVCAFNGGDAAIVDRYLIEDPHNLTWIRHRGSYHVDKRRPATLIACVAVLCILFSLASITVLLFAHMFYFLRQETNNRNSHSSLLIRRSLRVLFLQVGVPLLYLGLPASTIFLGLVFEDLLSFEVSLGCFIFLPWHSVGHNFILLIITPTYRKIVISSAKRIMCCRQEASNNEISSMGTINTITPVVELL